MIRVASLFSGAGGSSVGYAQAGCTVVFACDNQKDACATYRANHPQTELFEGDIHDVGGVRTDIDILDGSPPCQSFTWVGERKADDPRSFLYQEYVRLASIWQPKVCIIENVPGMMAGVQAEYWSGLLFSLRRLGYATLSWKLNAWEYGVPQSRKRVIFIGYRQDVKKVPQRPQATHRHPVTLREALHGCVNTQEDIRMALLPEGKTRDLAMKVRPGQNGQDYMGKGKWFAMHRCEWHKAAPTITHQYAGYLHPDEQRSLTIAELRRVMTFPDEYVFVGSKRSVHQQIGNAVPPLFMRAIVESVIQQVYETRDTSTRYGNA